MFLSDDGTVGGDVGPVKLVQCLDLGRLRYIMFCGFAPWAWNMCLVRK